MNRLPCASTATRSGLVNCALRAGPPSPDQPGELPVPATVDDDILLGGGNTGREQQADQKMEIFS